MKINEFIKEVDKVAFANYDEDTGDLCVYEDEDADSSDWFLLLKPQRESIFDSHDWDSLDFIDTKDLTRVLNLVQKLDDTPVDERFPEKKYCLLMDYGKFVEDAFKTHIPGGDELLSIKVTHKPHNFTQSQLRSFSEATDIPMNVIDCWKEEAN